MNRYLAARLKGSLLALAMSCQPLPRPTPAPGPDATDAAPLPAPDPIPEPVEDDEAGASRTPCGRACATMKKFGCVEATTTPSGTTCTALCARIATFPGMRLDTACIIPATSKAALNKCGVCR